MNKTEKRVFLISNLVISIIGIAYYFFKYFGKAETQFGLRPHALTASFLHWHIITVPLLVLLVGYLLPIHIIPKLRLPKNRTSIRKKSGVLILISFVVMVISGYLLQMGFEFNDLVGPLHIIISFVWIIGFLWHFRMKL